MPLLEYSPREESFELTSAIDSFFLRRDRSELNFRETRLGGYCLLDMAFTDCCTVPVLCVEPTTNANDVEGRGDSCDRRLLRKD